MSAKQSKAQASELVRRDVGLLMIRAILGIVLVFHGAQKLFGAFGGPGIEGMAGFNESLGIPLPVLSAYLAGGAEFFGGIAIAAGLGSRLAAIPAAFTLLVAFLIGHGGAFSAASGGGEYALTLAIVIAGIGLTGPGRFTVHRLLERAGVPVPALAV